VPDSTNLGPATRSRRLTKRQRQPRIYPGIRGVGRPRNRQERESAQLLDAEQDGESEQGEACELLGALAQRLVQVRAEPETELGEEERLSADQDDGQPKRQVEKADREADRELVEADRDSKGERDETVAASELADLFAFVLFLVQEHPSPEQRKHSDRAWPRRTPRTGIVISKLDITRLTRRRWRCGSPRMPSAAVTAKVSKPSGTTRRISLSTAAGGYSDDRVANRLNARFPSFSYWLR
jgi:hypothetical protein